MTKERTSRLNILLPVKTNMALQKFVLERKIEKMESPDSDLPANASGIIAEALEYFLKAQEKKKR